jgi:hypothetical protein
MELRRKLLNGQRKGDIPMAKENTKAPIDLVEYEPGVWSPRLAWDVSIFWVLSWPFRQLWRLGWDWFFTFVLLGGMAGWALIDWMGLMSFIEWAIRSFFAYAAGK